MNAARRRVCCGVVAALVFGATAGRILAQAPAAWKEVVLPKDLRADHMDVSSEGYLAVAPGWGGGSLRAPDGTWTSFDLPYPLTERFFLGAGGLMFAESTITLEHRYLRVNRPGILRDLVS